LVENDKNNADDENQNTQNSANVNNDVDWVTDDDDNEDVIHEEIKDKGNNRRSEVWKYFDILECTSSKTGKKEGFVKCNIDFDDGSKCGKMLKYHNSTKYLLNHLQSKHKIIEKVKNSNNPIKKDPKELLMMFIVTAALPLRCVENEYFVKERVPDFNIWDFYVGGGNSTNDKIAFEHPAIFPEELVKRHLESWSNENDLIYDPFMGSGTTSKMCLLLNRKYLILYFCR
jgi:hypothetical protein